MTPRVIVIECEETGETWRIEFSEPEWTQFCDAARARNLPPSEFARQCLVRGLFGEN